MENWLRNSSASSSSSVSSVIQTAAIQCPLIGGLPVYMARTMVALLDDAIWYDDQTNCALGYYKDEPEEEEITTPAASILLFPNPTATNATLYFYVPNATTSEIRVYDAMGQIVLKQTADISLGEATLQVENLSSGLYQVQLVADGAVAGTEKLNVVR